LGRETPKPIQATSASPDTRRRGDAAAGAGRHRDHRTLRNAWPASVHQTCTIWKHMCPRKGTSVPYCPRRFDECLPSRRRFAKPLRLGHTSASASSGQMHLRGLRHVLSLQVRPSGSVGCARLSAPVRRQLSNCPADPRRDAIYFRRLERPLDHDERDVPTTWPPGLFIACLPASPPSHRIHAPRKSGTPSVVHVFVSARCWTPFLSVVI
jgi:hypothetical protein